MCLRDRAVLVAAFALAGVLLAGAYAWRAPRLYQASATVQVEPVAQRVIGIEDVMQEELRSEVSVNTMVQKLRNRPLLERVLEVEQLGQEPAFATAGDGADPAVRLNRLEGMVTTALRRMTRLVDITVTSRSPQLSARIANAIPREFSALDQSAQVALRRRAAGFLDQEAGRLKAKVEAAEQALQRLREQAGSVGVQNSQSYFLPKLQEASVRLGQTRAEATRLQASYERMVSLTNRPDDLLVLPETLREAALTPGRQRLAQAEAAFAACQLRYKAKHPKYQQATAQVEEARHALRQEALKLPESHRLAIAAALATLASIEAEVKRTEAEALRFSAQEVEYKLLARQVESDRAMLAAVLNRLAETDVTTELRSEKVRLIQPAVAPRAPASPRVLLLLAAGLLGGLLAGLAAALGAQAFDRSVQSAEQAEAEFDLPLLQVIPRLTRLPTAPPLLVTDDRRHPLGAEVFRTLRTAVAMLDAARGQRSFLFTSTAPEEGKTFTALNFAATLAQQGLKTLLVDADLRRPSVEEYLTGSATLQPGLTEFLADCKVLSEVAHPLPGHPNLCWISAGQPVPNPAELLLQDCLEGFLSAALREYDRVVVDSAPVAAVSDTLAIARSCGATILVVRSHATPRRAIQRTIQMLRQAGANLCGLALNLEAPRRLPACYQASAAAGRRRTTPVAQPRAVKCSTS